jgi:transcriptional regulator with XRE-family HTH domain
MSLTIAIIKALRHAGLTQSDIARRTGIPQPRLSKWESGATPAGADDALRLQQLHQDICASAGGAVAHAPVTPITGMRSAA